MGKGEIISEYADGKYLIKVLYDRDGYDKQMTALSARATELDAEILALEVQLLADPTNTELERQLRLARIKRMSAAKRIEYLEDNAPPEGVARQAWCVDYSEDLTGEVATIEMPGYETEAPVQIAPGYSNHAAWSRAMHGQLTHAATMTPAAVFYNLAMKPGWLKWMPFYRRGTIQSIDHAANTATVYIDAATAVRPGERIHGESVNQTDVYLENVPFEYMRCDSAAFEAGDEVVVKFRGQAEMDGWSDPVVIGFQEFPRNCAPVSSARITEHYSETGYYIGNLQLWVSMNRCTFDDNGDEESIHIGQYLRDHYGDEEGIWRLVDYRFARDNAAELVVLVERFFTAYRNLPLVPNLIYKAGIEDSYTAIVFRISDDRTVSIRDIYTVDYGTRKCIGGCTARYPDPEPDYESPDDCPGWSNACGEAEGCCSSYTAEAADTGSGSSSHAWGDVSWTASSDCRHTCERACSGTTCCYNCVDGVDIQKAYLVYGEVPRLYGEKGTTTHATSRELSSESRYDNTRTSDEETTNYTSCRDTEWAGLWPDPRTQHTVRSVTSGVLAETIEHPGQPDDPEVYGDQSCTACCGKQKIREYTRDVRDYTYSAGFGWADECDPLYNPCQCPKEGYSESITAQDDDTGWVWNEYASRHVCFDKTLQSAARLVYGAPANYNCDTYKEIDFWKEKTLGSFQYAAGVSCNDCTEFSWDEMCDCDENRYESATCCTPSFGDAGGWGWGASFTVHDVFDLDVYVDASYEWEHDFLGATTTDVQNAPEINGSAEDGFIFSAANPLCNLDGFTPIQSMPQDADHGMCFAARHSQYVGENKFASFTTAFSGGTSLERVRCSNTSVCYEELHEDGLERKWSVLVHRDGAGAVIFKDPDDDQYYGAWAVCIYSRLPQYVPTDEDINGNGEDPGWAEAGCRYVQADLQKADLILTLQSSPMSSRQSFRLGVTARPV